jgi:hypothetical protein
MRARRDSHSFSRRVYPWIFGGLLPLLRLASGAPKKTAIRYIV